MIKLNELTHKPVVKPAIVRAMHIEPEMFEMDDDGECFVLDPEASDIGFDCIIEGTFDPNLIEN